MSNKSLPHGSHANPSSDAELTSPTATASRWGTVSGGLRSPPPAPSSGAGVRRSHTIHGARHHGKPRLEKHFEQPEDYPANASDAGSTPQQDSHARMSTSQSSPSEHANPSLEHPSPSHTSDAGDFVSSLYSKSAVSRNLSLPSRHSTKLASGVSHSATQGRASAFNSLSAITGGSDLDEHDWEKLIHSSDALGDEHQQDPKASHSNLPWSSSLFSQQLSPPAEASQLHSPMLKNDLFMEPHKRSANASTTDLFEHSGLAEAPALTGSAGFVRRHQSLNHNTGRAAAHRLAARSNDLLGRYAGDATDLTVPAYPGLADAAFSPVRHTTSLSAASSPVMPTSFSKAPWNQPAQDPIGSPSRFAGNFPPQNIDSLHSRFNSGIEPASSSLLEVSNTLSNLDISGSSALAADDTGENVTPTAANPQSHSMHPSLSVGSSSDSRNRKLPQLVTNRDALQRGGQRNGAGPMSAAAYVPPIGHAHSRHQSNDPSAATFDNDQMQRLGPFTAAPAGNWLDMDTLAGRANEGQPPWPHQPSASYGSVPGMDPNVVALSMALAQEQQRNAILQAQLGARTMEPGMFGMQPMDLNGAMASIGQQLRGGPFTSSPPVGGMTSLPPRVQPFPTQPQFRPPVPLPAQQLEPNSLPIPVDPTSLAVSKGYNPPASTLVPPPPVARYFVIKSYTEEDVHKSLKYEIWASTDKGNARLDRAFRESSSAGPIYLFFSVNASGHFCGMAQMLTPLDYATSSNVWAQDGKWKGTFKVRWIYVKDLPNNQLRHIKLTNTAECRPVTQSRDTQELTTEAGREVLRIMAEWEPRTSLLQDFGFYEMQGQGRAEVARVQGSPAMGLQPRRSPQPGASPALGGAMAYPTSPELGLASRTPNGGARRAQLPGTPHRMHGVSALGLAPGTPRANNNALPGPGAQQISDLRNDKAGDPPLAASQDATTAANKDAVSAAQVAGLAPSAL